MYTIQPKKMITINILEILKKYSDFDHRLTQKDIAEILKKEYLMDVDRKTISRNLMNLLDLDCGIEYNEIQKKDKDGNPFFVYTDWYMIRDFDDSEIRLLIDSLLFSKHIPYSQCKNLIEKLKGLSNIYFDKKVKHICNLPENQPENKELFHTIDVLEDAISQNKKVAFIYNSYGVDKKLHPRRDTEYIISPYQMVATNGRYYLICNAEDKNSISNFRIDRITKIRMTNQPIRDVKELDEGELNLPKHMAEHLYMFAGETVRGKFRIKNSLLDHVIDWFGKNIEIIPENNEQSIIKVNVNKEAFFLWSLQYGMHVEILEPIDLRNRMIKTIKEMGERYEN